MDQNKKLYRSKDNRMICGICGGISNLTGVDVTIIRLIFAVVSFLLGFFIGGLILYFIAAIIIPLEPDHIDI